MTKSELLIRSITGPVKMDIRLFAFSVEIAEHMLFTKKIPLEQLQVTVDIYPQAAKQFSKSLDAAERQIERLGNFCWDCMDAEQVQKYIGRKIRDIEYSELREQPVRRLRATIPVARSQSSVSRATKRYF